MTLPAIVSHHSFVCRFWRGLGVLLLLAGTGAQTGTDLYVHFDAAHAKRVTAACLAKPPPKLVEGVSCKFVTKRRLFRKRLGVPERLIDDDLAAWSLYLADLVWFFLCADIVVHLVSGKRVKGNLKPLAWAYLASWWFVVDALSVSPPLLSFASAKLAAFLTHAAGLDHPLRFVLHHLPKPPKKHKLIRPGKIIRKLLGALIRFAFRNRRLIRAAISEATVVAEVAAVAKTAVQEAEVIAELTEQAEDAIAGNDED